MRWIRRLGVGALALGALLTVLLLGARCADGPFGMLPGGPLKAGALHTGPEPDWTFARDLPTLEFQLVTPPVSRTIWLQVVDGKLYVVSGYMNTTFGKLWKQWPLHAQRDPRAVIRVNGTRYERRVERLGAGHPALPGIAAEVERKYGVPLRAESAASGDAWFYAFAPRKRDADE